MLHLVAILKIGAAITALVGAGKAGKAIKDRLAAKNTNKKAKQLYEKIKHSLDSARGSTKKQLECLGKKKLQVCEETIGKFVRLYEKIKNIKLRESDGMDELNKFKIDKQGFADLKEMNFLATSIAKSAASGVLTGGAIAFGAWGAVGTFATASTGTAISSLSGAAATNATLAWLGGGSIAAGGSGMAGGVLLLGGLVTGPALLVFGVIMSSAAKKDLEDALSNLAEVKKMEGEVALLVTTCNGITQRAKDLTNVLKELNNLALSQINALDNIIQTEGIDFAQYSTPSRERIAALLSTMQAIKAIIDTPILTKSGLVTRESKNILDEANVVLINSSPETKKSSPK